ncbi:MAG: hypothetical protein LBE92_08985 [Chryseobacterium sp.]|uniref:hypothetical protein n=1 Tax=Chryseobacterium sp. TaxID=1871047 RepID=UPI00281E280F|nr:hypothetical protein [Chryseobacterium sp.]MDR2236245.1 hypothetical protein [Chryseobacterium sp.]
MKRIFYFILLVAGLSSIHSCKDMLDDDGDPLIDLNETSGLTGPRALYREITDKDTLAEYHYSGLLLTKVLMDSASVADIAYSGDKISQITFNGFLDLDGNGKLDKDSVNYTQLFTYGPNGKLVTISENRSIFRRPAPVPPATDPGPQTLLRQEKASYEIKYNASTAKLDSIKMKRGVEVPGTAFANNEYALIGFTYLGDNVSKAQKFSGPITAGVPGTANLKYSYEYTSYDNEISPFTLLPAAYKISRLISTKFNEKESHIFSPNSPKRVLVTDLIPPLPTSVLRSTNYNYDLQTYMTRGFGINYIYKPL